MTTPADEELNRPAHEHGASCGKRDGRKIFGRTFADIDETAAEHLQIRRREAEHNDQLKEMQSRMGTPWEIGEAPDERTGSDSAKRKPRVWSAVLISGGVIAVCGAFGLVMNQEVSHSKSTITGTGMHPPEAVSSTMTKAGQCLSNFLVAGTLQEKCQFARHPESVLARMNQLARENRLPVIPPDFRILGGWREKQFGTKDFIWCEVVLGGALARTAVFEVTAEGTLLLDWETLIYYSEIPWATFLADETEEPVEFRVVAEFAEYHNFAYSDARRYLCLKLADAENTGSCWAYAERNSDAGRRLTVLLDARRNPNNSVSWTQLPGMRPVAVVKPNYKPIRPILTLRFRAQDKGRSQVWIDKVASNQWLKVEP